MSTSGFTLTLLDGKRVVWVDELTSLIAVDASGQFGVLPGHAAMVTVIEPGLFRYRTAQNAAWTWGACAGGLLSCRKADGQTQVHIVSWRFLQGDEPETLVTRLEEALQREHTLMLTTRESQAQFELALYKRMQRLTESPS